MVPNPLQPEIFEEEDCTENNSSNSSSPSECHSNPVIVRGSDCSDSSLASSLQHMASHNSTVSETAATTKAKVVDSMLSKEMYHLSVANRNAINEEIHGARCIAPEESPELIEQSLLDLQRCLDGMPYKPAYDRAQAYAQHPLTAGTSYVNTIEFRLKFLRCELFSVRAAAIRLINYLELVFEMYGLFALQRKVLISDFSKHEMQILRAGYFQIFPFRDRSGRRVMCIVGNMGIEFDPIIRVSKTRSGISSTNDCPWQLSRSHDLFRFEDCSSCKLSHALFFFTSFLHAIAESLFLLLDGCFRGSRKPTKRGRLYSLAWK